MNQIGFDFWTLGNGEFYDGIQNLQAMIARVKCKVLCANITTKADGKPVGLPYVIEQVGPVKVAFLGVSFIHVEHPSSRPLVYGNPIETASRLARELRKQADVVVAITHIGLPEDMKLAAQAPEIDVVIGGHTHLTLPNGVRVPAGDGREVLVCQAGAFLHYLGRVDLQLRQAEGKWKIENMSEKLITLDDKVKMDPAITALIARLSESVETTPAMRVK